MARVGNRESLWSEMSSAIPRQSVVYDERRNSSRVFPVPPSALLEAEAALGGFRRSKPALYAWVAEGAPRLTEVEHLTRFGEPYKAACSKRS